MTVKEHTPYLEDSQGLEDTLVQDWKVYYMCVRTETEI